MICIDNSEWMRNGDYAPNRFQAQADAVNLICGAKTQVRVRLLFFDCWKFLGFAMFSILYEKFG